MYIEHPPQKGAGHFLTAMKPRGTKGKKTFMTPNEYRELRKSVGTQQDVAAALGVDYRTIQRREYGEIKIPREAEMALRALANARALG
jgi:DNA-binding transcriptional regulator YiaG